MLPMDTQRHLRSKISIKPFAGPSYYGTLDFKLLSQDRDCKTNCISDAQPCSKSARKRLYVSSIVFISLCLSCSCSIVCEICLFADARRLSCGRVSIAARVRNRTRCKRGKHGHSVQKTLRHAHVAGSDRGGAGVRLSPPTW